MHYYPTQIPFIKRESNQKDCKFLCRPDALSYVVAEILNLGKIDLKVTSVETRGSDTASFLIVMHVREEYQTEFRAIIKKYEEMR